MEKVDNFWGAIIRQTRINAGLTQVELGKRLGVSGSMIGQWENNLRHPKIETINKIAAVLGFKVSADVVEVVRCKDCVAWEQTTFNSSDCRGLCIFHSDIFHGDYFCADGERKV